MIRRLAAFALLLTLPALAACGLDPGRSANQFSGINSVTIERDITPDGEVYEKTLQANFGKQGEDIDLSLNRPDGTVFTYSAGRLEAFEGQKARAAVEAVIAQETARLGIAITDAAKSLLTDAILAALGMPPAPAAPSPIGPGGT